MKPPSSHATAWTVGVILALPVIYLLSVPPVSLLAKNVYARRGINSTPGWLHAYIRPYIYLHEDTRLKKPLDACTQLWFEDGHGP